MFYLDVIAQIIILLGAICNIVVGLRTEVCEFIINTAVLLVRLTMDSGWTPGQRPEASCDAHQEFILKWLPTSLYTALGKFDIEGESTLQWLKKMFQCLLVFKRSDWCDLLT